jgi:Lrp/AsnC family transcriptional regulator, leucine-responsive regulatory protein
MVNLDLKDRKILFELDTNSRQSFHDIAKKVGLSKDGVMYRIDKLQKEGIIQSYQTLIDVGKLGYISFRLYLKLQNMTPEKETELIDYFKQQKIVTWIASMEGDYELALWVLTKSVAEMNVLWKNIHKNYGNYIAKHWLAIFTKVSYYPRVFLINKESNLEEYLFITEPDDQHIDDIDTSLLRHMAPNARIPILELAKLLGITAKTVSTRIRSLEKRKIILGYRTLFNLEILGQQYFKLFIKTHNVTEQKEKQFKEYIKQHPNTIYDNEVLGGEDFEIEIQIGSLQEFRTFLNAIKSQFHSIIEKYYYLLIYKEHKFVFFPG